MIERTPTPHVAIASESRGAISWSHAARVGQLVRARAWLLALWASMLVWCATLFAVLHARYTEFRLARFDLGNMVQAVWNTAHGRLLETTTGATGEQVARLAAHVDPILVLLAPLWIVAPTPVTLVAVQVIAVGLGALPMYWLGRLHLGSERLAVLLALTYLMYPWTAWAALDAFHPVVLAVPLFLFCIWFLETGRPVWFVVSAVLVLSTGELMGLSLAALGVWYALARRGRWAGAAIAALGVSWTAVALLVVVPAFSGGSSAFYGAFAHVGGSPQGVVKTIFTDPGTILSAVVERHDVLYLLVLSVPLCCAFLLAPAMAAIALIPFGVNVLSGVPAMTQPRLHYVAAILPFLFAATVIGLGRIRPANRARAAFVVATFALAGALAVGPWPGPFGGTPIWRWADVSPQKAAALREAVSMIPVDAPVSSTNRVGSHLSARRFVYLVPIIGRAEWIVLDSSDSWVAKTIGGSDSPSVLKAFKERIAVNPNWELAYSRNGVLVFRKVTI